MFALSLPDRSEPSVNGPAPVPAAHAEAVAWLLDALAPGGVAFLLRASPELTPGWLTPQRLERHLHVLLMEPAQTRIWPLLDNVWVLALRLSGDASDPLNALHVHTLHHALEARLGEEWKQEGCWALGIGCSETSRKEGEASELDTQDPTPEFSGSPPVREPESTQHPTPFTLIPIAPMTGTEGIQDNIAELNALLEIILNKQLTTQFQPIVSLRDGQVIGYEALIRGPKGATLRRGGAMFRAADKARMVSWYDLACQEQCFAQAASLGLKHHLFVNMDAEGLAYLDMHERTLAMRAREYGLSPARIVVEITERQTVGDFPRLLQAIGTLREEGFKIAIDDAGAGYNSLHVIAEVRPEFVKIDRSLIRNLNAQGESRALLAALTQYARQIGTAVLAEGAETRDELAALIRLGVAYGQGYLLGKPADSFRGVPRETRAFIQEQARRSTQEATGQKVTAGDLACPGLTMPPDTPVADAIYKFTRLEGLTSIVVVEEELPCGLVMREQVKHLLGKAQEQEIRTLLDGATLAQWMQTGVLTASEETLAMELARQTAFRSDISLDADILVLRSGLYVGVLPVRVLMEAVTGLQESRPRYADPLTGLPGRVIWEQVLDEQLSARQPLAAVRLDIARLEPYNRRFGVAHGDAVILAMAQMLREVSAAQGTESDFLAHFGGDDFLMLTSASAVPAICRALIEGFQSLLSRFYTAEQLRQGYVEREERGDCPARQPLMRLSVAACTHRRRPAHGGQVMEMLHDLLRCARRQSGSAFVIDFP